MHPKIWRPFNHNSVGDSQADSRPLHSEELINLPNWNIMMFMKLGLILFNVVLLVYHSYGQRDFAAAVLLPHAAALAAAVKQQFAAVELTVHVELLGITVIGSLKCARVLSCI
jgi:hypothetical protein